MLIPFTINWQSEVSDSTSCDSSRRNTTIFFIEARSERQRMTSKTKVIIITTDESLVQEISTRTDTSIHIIDWNTTAKPNTGLLADLSQIVCTRKTNCFIKFKSYFRIVKLIKLINELSTQLPMNRQDSRKYLVHRSIRSAPFAVHTQSDSTMTFYLVTHVKSSSTEMQIKNQSVLRMH